MYSLEFLASLLTYAPTSPGTPTRSSRAIASASAWLSSAPSISARSGASASTPAASTASVSMKEA